MFFRAKERRDSVTPQICGVQYSILIDIPKRLEIGANDGKQTSQAISNRDKNRGSLEASQDWQGRNNAGIDG
jgi:hypothetical protein